MTALQAQAPEAAEKPKEKGKMEVNRSKELDGGERIWTTLLNGQEANIIPVSRPDLIAGESIKLKEVERHAADEVDVDDPAAAKVMKEQMAESHVEAQEVNELTAIFREFGPDIYLLREMKATQEGDDGEHGLDTEKFGNKIDFDKGMTFVIGASRGDELKSLFAHPPAVSGTEMATAFDIEPWNHLYNEGFIVKYRHETQAGAQVLSEFRFLYAQDTNVRSLEAFRTKNEQRTMNNEQ